jgi:hypothetical protein
MPAFDGTGLMGLGPMTGGGRGWCHPYYAGIGPSMTGYRYFQPFGWGVPYGFAAISAFPYMPPHPWPFGWWGPYGAPSSPQEETRFWEDEAKMKRKELEEIEVRIRELEKDKGMSPDELTTLD